VLAEQDAKMFLREFTEPNPIVIKMIGLTSQLKSDIDNGQAPGEWTLDELLQFYNDHGISIGKDSMYDAIKKPPMNKFISNIQGDKVVFKGQQGDIPDQDQDNNQKIVQQMAQSAMK
jgi:hypothetical protein